MIMMVMVIMMTMGDGFNCNDDAHFRLVTEQAAHNTIV